MKEAQERLREEWLLMAIKSALNAGKAILEVYRSDFSIDFKTDDSPLTAADTRAHRIIEAGLQGTMIPLLSEEGHCPDYEERRSWQQFWMVDPLDGTKEFIRRNGEFTVNIALIEHGKPLMGVIYAPVPDELYFALKTTGSYKTINALQKIDTCENLNQLTVQSLRLPVAGLKQGLVAVCSRRHMNDETYEYLRKISPDPESIQYISRGSSLKFCAVAEGSADIYPRFAPTMEWDSAAGQAIAEISGAGVIDAHTNQPLHYNKQNLLNPSFVVFRKASSSLNPTDNIL